MSLRTDTLNSFNWTFSTPSQCRTDGTSNNELWTASTGSILRSSSRYRGSTQCESRQRKRVRIVSPIKWDTHNNTPYSMQRRREFINSTIMYTDLKRILRNIGCNVRGGYEECVETLLQSNWIPERRYIELDEKLRAKPIHESGDRVIKLKRTDFDYLANFSRNELRKWLKYNNIAQPSNASKHECVQIIRQNFLWRSPTPDSIRLKAQPLRPCTTQKTKCRTPRHVNIHHHMDDIDDIDDDMDDMDAMDIDNIDDIENDEEMMPMQLCFDD